MTEQPTPSVTAMLLCDQVITEQGTNKKSLIGIFETIAGLGFPMVIPRLSIYVRMLDGFGRYPFTLRVVKLKDETLVAEVEINGEVPDHAHAAELVFNFIGLPIPEAGKYEFQLYTRDTYLHRVTLETLQVQGGDLPWQPKQRR